MNRKPENDNFKQCNVLVALKTYGRTKNGKTKVKRTKLNNKDKKGTKGKRRKRRKEIIFRFRELIVFSFYVFRTLLLAILVILVFLDTLQPAIFSLLCNWRKFYMLQNGFFIIVLQVCKGNGGDFERSFCLKHSSEHSD